MAYLIQINEEQRIALLELVTNAPVSVNGNDAPLAFWVDMLKALPTDEAAQPGAINGFCL
jgi:hypothetical protein